MAQQTISIGTSPNDGTGTSLRLGGNMINANFTELYAALAALGSGASGSWTPALTTDGVNFSGVTYDALTQGTYVKIGKLVHIQARLRTDAITVGPATGSLLITGLPFTPANNQASLAVSAAVNFVTLFPLALNIATTGLYLVGRAALNGNTSFLGVANAGTGADANDVRFGGAYIAA